MQSPPFLTLFYAWKRGAKMKTNPSVSPFRKGRDKNEKFFNTHFFKDGHWMILLMCKESKAKKFTSYFIKT